VHYGSVEATLDRQQGANVWLTFAIKEGKNREVRNVLLHLGLKVNRLIRVGFGPFELGALEAGAVEEVPTDRLRASLGELAATFDFDGPVLEREAPSLRHSGARAKPASPESITTAAEHGFRARPSGPSRNDPRRKHRRDRSGGPRPSRPKPSDKPENAGDDD
jgi:23S rRNA pseudouridine2605 synthase